MYKKKYYRFALMSLIVFGLSLGVASCKDDDKNSDSGDDMEQAESTGGDMTLAETQLASLIGSFGGLEAQEQLALPGWKGKTYEATVGLVLNESRPTVRTIEVGTTEAADEQAALLLDALGFNTNDASGFTFADSEVGTVSYQHGGGDANTLAVINISVKQLPNITQLQMVRQYPTNPGGAPFYQLGDIIQKDDRLWICTNPATAVGLPAYFVSFRTDDHPTDRCRWGNENDIVYAAKAPMANAAALASWMKNFLLDDKYYNIIISRLKAKAMDAHIDEIIPSDKEMRWVTVSALRKEPDDNHLIEALSNPEGIKAYTWPTKQKGRIVAPMGMLLCDKFRWSAGFFYNYWVPHLLWVDSWDFQGISQCMKDKLDFLDSQNNSHFQWVDYGEEESKAKQLTNERTTHYHIIKGTTHWQHKYFTLDDNPKQWAVFDFTKDWGEHEEDGELPLFDSDETWVRRNITSSQIVYTDNGDAMKDVEDVWARTVDGMYDSSYYEDEDD